MTFSIIANGKLAKNVLTCRPLSFETEAEAQAFADGWNVLHDTHRPTYTSRRTLRLEIVATKLEEGR